VPWRYAGSRELFLGLQFIDSADTKGRSEDMQKWRDGALASPNADGRHAQLDKNTFVYRVRSPRIAKPVWECHD
jgi:hypothetical protein